ncbi:MAG: hypothetical protein JO069_09055 [Verrucomicrobia bacterium]|nr:hypothetical protein [Verrucomicrobiota bacterium]
MKSPVLFVAAAVLCIGAILAAENALLRRIWSAIRAAERQNDLVDQANRRLAKEILELRASQSRIEAIYLRAKDSIVTPRAVSAIANRSLPRPDETLEQAPGFIQQLNDSGIVTHLNRTPPGEMAQVYEGGASRLELHRFIPVLAEQENSNAFLFVDRLALNRPASVPPFSAEPTYLDARFTFRVLMSSR